MTCLTDKEIDRLSGKYLDEAVCISLGWKWCMQHRSKFEKELVSPDRLEGREQCTRPKPETLAWHASKWGMPWSPEYHSDVSEAFGLLSKLCHIGIEFGDDWLCVTDFEDQSLDVRGPKSLAATIMCRAYLKLVGRGDKSA